MRPSSNPRLLRVSALLALSVATCEVLAQATPAPGDTASVGSEPPVDAVVLQPIRVRGEASLTYRPPATSAGVLGDRSTLSTPFSVNTVSRELIANQQASYLGDFLKNDPSAVIGNVVISFATLRGFSLGSGGFLVDGLQLGSIVNDGRVSLEAFERVDVLKGASTFLTGLGTSSSLGGVINYVPKTAQAEPVRDVSLLYSSRSNVGLALDLGQRFGSEQQFGVRLNAAARDGETSVDDMKWRQGTLSLNTDWRATRDLSFQVGLYHVANDFKQMPSFFIGVADANGNAIPIPKAPDADKNFTPSWSTFNQKADLAWLRSDWSFAPDWNLTVQYGVGENERPYGSDLDARYGLIGDNGATTLFASQESFRVRAQAAQAMVRGKFSTGPLRHEVTAGLSASEEKNYASFAGAGFAPGSLYQPNPTPAPALVPLQVLPYAGKLTAGGLVVSDIVQFTDRWSVLLGGRQAKLTTYDANDQQTPGGSISRFSPTAALMFKPTADTLVYANYADGLEPGGTAPAGSVNVGDIMAPLVTKQFEIGAKARFDGATVTAALFDMRRPLQSRNAAGVWVSEGDQVHRGFELLATGAVTRDLRIVAGTMLLDAKQTATNDPATEGKRVAGVARWTANAWADYRIAAVPGLFLNAGVYHSARQYFDNANLQSIPSWTRLDIGGRYVTQAAGHPLTLLVAVENATNRSHWQSAIGNALTLADPLTVKATARFSF